MPAHIPLETSKEMGEYSSPCRRDITTCADNVEVYVHDERVVEVG